MEKEKRTRGITDVLLILVITILAGTVLILACGASPMEAYGLFFRGIFGTPAGFAEIFVKDESIIKIRSRTGFSQRFRQFRRCPGYSDVPVVTRPTGSWSTRSTARKSSTPISRPRSAPTTTRYGSIAATPSSQAPMRPTNTMSGRTWS